MYSPNFTVDNIIMVTIATYLLMVSKLLNSSLKILN